MPKVCCSISVEPASLQHEARATEFRTRCSHIVGHACGAVPSVHLCERIVGRLRAVEPWNLCAGGGSRVVVVKVVTSGGLVVIYVKVVMVHLGPVAA